MHTVEMLDQALSLLKKVGYLVRQEWLGGNGGGGCELRGRKVFFLDLAMSPAEQLDQVLDALRREATIDEFPMPLSLRELLRPKRSA